MRAAVDLHIHSALSPCSDNSMTPNNIVNMAMLKGLDFIAVTDHNSAENIQSVLRCAEGKNLIIVPGMEIESSEEVHLICLFPKLQSVLEMQSIVYQALPDLKNREYIFGQQLIFNESDEEIGQVGRLLLTATKLSVEDIYHYVISLGGVVIPAHVDRDSYSILSNLGQVPEELKIKYIEFSRNCKIKEFVENNPNLNQYSFIKSSDAHSLGNILERESILTLYRKSIEGLLEELRAQ